MLKFIQRASFTHLSIFTLILMTAGIGTCFSADVVTFTVETGKYEIIDRAGGQEVLAEDFGSLLVPGKPKLPRKIVAMAIPPGTRMTDVRIQADPMVLLEGRFDIMPTPMFRSIGKESPEILKRDQKIWQQNNTSVYGSDALYADSPGAFVRTAAYRKYNLVDVSITPFAYRPLSGRLYYYPSITIEVAYEPVLSGYDLPLVDFHPVAEKRAREIILNYEEAQSWYPAAPGGGRDATDLVIITPASLESAVASLVTWEQSRGRGCEVVTVEWIDANYSGTDQAARIRAFLREKYPTSEWGIQDVLLAGHHNEVAMRTGWQDIGYGRPRTDFYYAELSLPDDQSWDKDGDGRYGESYGDEVDFYSEVNVGRIPWSDAATMQHICDKSVAYEQNNDPAFKKNILLLGSFFWETTDTAVLMEAKVDQPWMSDWTITRLYEQNSTVYSGYDCDYEINHSNAQSVWSGGKFAFTNWAGHGSPTSAHMMGYGSQAFVHTGDCTGLNDSYPSIVFADSCSNSDTDANNIGRAMMKQGAVGFVGATNVAYGCWEWNDPSDGSTQSLDYYFTTAVTSGEYTQGEAHQKALLQLYTMGGWYDNLFETFEWTLWGNPCLGMGESAESIPMIAAPGPWANNTSDVRVLNTAAGGAMMTEFKAYGADKYGANVAFGDIDQDGGGEILTGPGPGAIFGPHIRAFELSGTPLQKVNFMAYGTSRMGAGVTCGDVDGDGIAEILTGPGPAEVFGPHVRGWNYDGGNVAPIPGLSFFAYKTRKNGVNVACGDVDGDHTDEILTGAGPGVVFGPHVRGWNYDGGTLTGLSSVNFLAYSSKQYGVRVASGDISGDDRYEIITGPGPGPALGSHVRAFSVDTGKAQLIPGADFMAFPGLTYGVVVAAGNADDTGKHDIITGAGPGYENFAQVKGWRFESSQVTLIPGMDFNAFSSPEYRYGVCVAIGW